MGTDIHTYVEVQTAKGWQQVSGRHFGPWGRDFAPFDSRSYGVFAFLAGVRNYSAVEPIAEPRGFPDDASPNVREHYEEDLYCPSWLLVSELLAVDYDREINDRRGMSEREPGSYDCGATLPPEEGTVQPLREFLREGFMEDLEALAALGDPDKTRVVFWFEN